MSYILLLIGFAPLFAALDSEAKNDMDVRSLVSENSIIRPSKRMQDLTAPGLVPNKRIRVAEKPVDGKKNTEGRDEVSVNTGSQNNEEGTNNVVIAHSSGVVKEPDGSAGPVRIDAVRLSDANAFGPTYPPVAGGAGLTQHFTINPISSAFRAVSGMHSVPDASALRNPVSTMADDYVSQNVPPSDYSSGCDERDFLPKVPPVESRRNFTGQDFAFLTVLSSEVSRDGTFKQEQKRYMGISKRANYYFGRQRGCRRDAGQPCAVRTKRA